MRKYLLIILFFLVISLGSCEGSGEEIDIDVKIIEMKTVLTTGNYVLEETGYADRYAYEQSELYDKYNLDYRIYKLFVGYVNNDERQVYLVSFQDLEEAKDYERRLSYDDDEDEDGKLVYREDGVLVITYSQETIDLFD